MSFCSGVLANECHHLISYMLLGMRSLLLHEPLLLGAPLSLQSLLLSLLLSPLLNLLSTNVVLGQRQSDWRPIMGICYAHWPWLRPHRHLRSSHTSMLLEHHQLVLTMVQTCRLSRRLRGSLERGICSCYKQPRSILLF